LTAPALAAFEWLGRGEETAPQPSKETGVIHSKPSRHHRPVPTKQSKQVKHLDQPQSFLVLFFKKEPLALFSNRLTSAA
jgi:hypothetical protein